NIRSGAGVGVYADFAGKEPHIPRPARGRQAYTDPRLQDGVTLVANAVSRIEAGPIQRVGQGAREAASGIARELRVCVEGDDKFDGGENRSIAENFGKGIARAAAKQRVEFAELAAFALVAHP